MGVFPPLDSHYYKYRTPTGSQALGQSILALAYGSKGIFYETYYSYISSAPGWGDYFAESLVGNNSDDFDRPRSNDYGLYDTIVSLGKRLKGPLGNLLPKLEFSGEESYIYNTWQRDRKQNSINPSKLKIFGEGIPEYPNNRFLNLGITRLQPKTSFNLTGDYYFLLNQITFDNFTLDPEVISTYNSLHVGINVSGFRNWRFYDIEGGDDFKFVKLNNHTGSDFTAIIPIGKGDGRLFRLIPTAASTGTFLTDEVITSGEIISSEGTITVPMGITLKIEGNYTLTDSLIIEDGGVLALEPGSTLNLDSASSVYCAGDLYINGTETNKVTINFLQPDETKQNSIYLGRESSAIVKYAEIKNGYSGISALNGFDTLIIDNCNFTNISHAALLLNGNGYDNAKITNNTYTNCDYAGFFSNLSTVVINSDSANTRSGYYFSNVSDLWFGNNKLTGTQEGPGMTLTGCFGNIYNNKITDHMDGILLAHSFPKIGGNEITNNTQRGLVCEYGAIPDLKAFSEVGDCEQMNTYPLSGFNNIPTAQLLAAQNTTNAITTTDQYHAQTEELTIALRGTTLNRNMKNDVGSITTMNKSGMNNLMKRHGNKFTIKKEPKPVEIITEYSLSQNYPNPFNSSTIIEYAIPKEGLVSMKLYDITGRLVKQLVNEQKPIGRHRTTIESGNLASGVYIYSLRVNEININKKLVILK